MCALGIWELTVAVLASSRSSFMQYSSFFVDAQITSASVLFSISRIYRIGLLVEPRAQSDKQTFQQHGKLNIDSGFAFKYTKYWFIFYWCESNIAASTVRATAKCKEPLMRLFSVCILFLFFYSFACFRLAFAVIISLADTYTHTSASISASTR